MSPIVLQIKPHVRIRLSGLALLHEWKAYLSTQALPCVRVSSHGPHGFGVGIIAFVGSTTFGARGGEINVAALCVECQLGSANIRCPIRCLPPPSCTYRALTRRHPAYRASTFGPHIPEIHMQRIHLGATHPELHIPRVDTRSTRSSAYRPPQHLKDSRYP